MKYYEKSNFNPGGYMDRIDTRDYMFDEIAGAVVQPFIWEVGWDIEVDLGVRLNKPKFKLPVKDQGPSFSCGGQSWASYAGVLEAVSTGTFEERSAKFLYSQTYVPGGGSRGRDNADIFVNQGTSKETTLSSYQNGNAPSEAFITRSQDITDAVRTDAKLSKALAYAQTGTDIDSIAVAIRDNSGVIIGLDGSNNGTWASTFPQSPAVVQWRHWVYALKAKLINKVKHVGILNSWGKDVGEEGIQWLSESYFKKNVWSGWTHVFKSLPIVDFAHIFDIDMRLGDKGEEIIALQKVLQMKGFFPEGVPTTGLYGSITQRAVKAFQVANGILNTSGNIVGPATRLKLNVV